MMRGPLVIAALLVHEAHERAAERTRVSVKKWAREYVRELYAEERELRELRMLDLGGES